MILRLAGVPEHFNYMWHLPFAREIMRKYGVVFQWTDFPGGTGAMSEALRSNEIDMAIMLTEGAIAAISAGDRFRIHFPFVMSPLMWGVFASARRTKKLPENYAVSKFAISRFQSGSHLMAKFLAQREGAELDENQFVISSNLVGARENLSNGSADYFLWEKYMTRPLVHSGEFVEVDEISAPWPSFVFVTKRDCVLTDDETWKEAVYKLTSNYLVENRSDLIEGICSAFSLQKTDAETWLNEVRYYDNNEYWKDRVTAAVIIMKSKGMIQNTPELSDLI